MPTYEYECEACDHAFEEFQSITSEPLKVCPACRKKKLRRLIGTGSALIFKGSGFYTTDYRSKDYQSRAKADKSSESSAASNSESSKSSSEGAKSSDGEKSSGGEKSSDSAKPGGSEKAASSAKSAAGGKKSSKSSE